MGVLRYFFLQIIFYLHVHRVFNMSPKQRSKNAVVIDRAIPTDC